MYLDGVYTKPSTLHFQSWYRKSSGERRERRGVLLLPPPTSPSLYYGMTEKAGWKNSSGSILKISFVVRIYFLVIYRQHTALTNQLHFDKSIILNEIYIQFYRNYFLEFFFASLENTSYFWCIFLIKRISITFLENELI